jgi:peptidoglycan/xylan/chitin deacetylase (PgdA/CDA1 family)
VNVSRSIPRPKHPDPGAAAAEGPRADEPLFDATRFLDGAHDVTTPRSRALTSFYALEPYIPLRIKLAVRRLYARRRSTYGFPAWPVEDSLVRLQGELFRAEMERRGVDRIPFLNFWPDAKRFAFVLTHDVEGPVGLSNIERVLDVERQHGVVSAWYFVAEDYEIPPGTFELIRSAGGEVGLHGLTHDGKLFGDRACFEAQLEGIHRCLRDWGAVGFRSPATHRNAAWMHELGCLYDSSVPDTDPFEPQPGGCCSILPFFLRDLVELPITLLQDHTLFETLEQRTADIWISKADWLVNNRGLVNVVVHSDYVDAHRLEVYDQLLAHLKGQAGGWHALPREVASWWRLRATLERDFAGRIPSALPHSVTVAHALLVGDRIEIEA